MIWLRGKIDLMTLDIKQVPASPTNYGVGRAGNKITQIILHWIVGTLESADKTFQNPKRLASAHYGIGDNEIHQYVKESDTAWHAGNLNVNLTSIGIEHEGGWEDPAGSGNRVKPSEETHKTSALLVAEIAKKYDIPLDRKHIKKHSEVSDKATSCCGTLDIDHIIELAREANSEPTIPPIVVKEDIPAYYENQLGLKSYPWYNNHYSWLQMFTDTTGWWNDSKKLKEIEDILADTKREAVELLSELASYKSRINALESAKIDWMGAASELQKKVNTLQNAERERDNLRRENTNLAAKIAEYEATMTPATAFKLFLKAIKISA